MMHHDSMHFPWDIPRSALEGVFAVSMSNWTTKSNILPVKLMQVLDLPHLLDVYLWVFGYLFNMTA